jgi:hypothetical protein
MAQSDRNKVDSLNRDWDRIVGGPLPDRQQKSATTNSGGDQKNPYDTQVESTAETVSNEDSNLYTAFALLASWGFEHPIGQMMAWHAEQKLPHTIHQMFTALERTRRSNKAEVSRLKENIRGMISMTYAWAYVMSKTGSLAVKDEHVYDGLIKLSATAADSEDRKRLTQSAENKLESTLGLLLTAHDTAVRESRENLQCFYIGAMQAVFALANEHFGKQATFVEAT